MALPVPVPVPRSVSLSGHLVSLVPLSLSHLPALLAIATDPRELYPLTPVPRTEEGLRTYLGIALDGQAHGMTVPFATCRKDTGEVVGCTRFANIEHWQFPPDSPERRREIDAVEIGWTWLSPDAQRTGVNTEAKLLMLTHAFETWNVRRVTLKTDRRNERSRTAILRLGCQLEGVLRSHGPGWDGLTRDVAYFSLLDREWPEARKKLEARLRLPG